MTPYWLPALADWRGAIRAVEQDTRNGSEAWAALVRLANHRLDVIQTERLDRALTARFGREPPSDLPTAPVCLAVLGSSTTTHLLASIRVAGLRRNLWVDARAAEYGQYRQVLAGAPFDADGFRPNVCLLALDAVHLLSGVDVLADRAVADATARQLVETMRDLWRQARTFCDGQIIHQTMLPVFTPLLGMNEYRLPGSAAALVETVNGLVRQAAAEEGVDLLALDSRAARDGLDRWHDPLLWHRAKQEVGPGAAPMYGELVARLLAAQQGRSAKCLVLDLDNTLWGGVIGDEGLEGIVLGQGGAAGEAFADFQRYAAALGRRGVILAVCSKNDEAIALEAFDRHPEMVLRRGDIAAFRANWTDKAANLRAIAAELNIGLDALVFADDNPFERTLVRTELPMVAVPELPDDPALFARCIGDAGYFESLGLTEEDAVRTRRYADNRDRAALQSQATDLASYLRSLDMELRWSHVNGLGLERVSQLVNKTNQFNLTTHRRSREQIAALIDDPRWLVVQFRLVDRLGDNGMIAVVIGFINDDRHLEIDSWLMSCRVLGRGVEEATIATVMGEARRMGATGVVGRYRPTPKNAMVANLFPRLGFAGMDENEVGAGETYFRTLTPEALNDDLPFRIIEEQDGSRLYP